MLRSLGAGLKNWAFLFFGMMSSREVSLFGFGHVRHEIEPDRPTKLEPEDFTLPSKASAHGQWLRGPFCSATGYRSISRQPHEGLSSMLVLWDMVPTPEAMWSTRAL